MQRSILPQPNNRQYRRRLLWETFKHAYLGAAHKASASLVHQFEAQARSWPERFLRKWEKKAAELAEDKDGSFIEFGY